VTALVPEEKPSELAVDIPAAVIVLVPEDAPEEAAVVSPTAVAVLVPEAAPSAFSVVPRGAMPVASPTLLLDPTPLKIDSLIPETVLEPEAAPAPVLLAFPTPEIDELPLAEPAADVMAV